MKISTIPADWQRLLDEPIIADMADTDGYMLRMFDLFSGDQTRYLVPAEFRFINRKIDQKLAEIIPIGVFRAQLGHVWTLKFPQYAIEYMKAQNFLRSGAYRRISNFKWPNLRIERDLRGQLVISTDGDLKSAFIPEIPILRIESALYTIFSCIQKGISLEEVERVNLQANIRDLEMLNAYKDETGYIVPFGDFACRRPALPHLHDFNVDWWLENGREFFSGTSWVGKAAKTGQPIQASIGHVFMIANATIDSATDESLRASHVRAFQEWIDYCDTVSAQNPEKPLKKVVVTDTFGTAFARNGGGITDEQARVLDVMRPDSGIPEEECAADIEFWHKHGRQPMEVGTLLADGMDVAKTLEIHRQFVNRTRLIFARGGDFANKIAGSLIPKQSTVFKPWYIAGKPCVKLSNDMGKSLSPSAEEIERYRRVFAVN